MWQTENTHESLSSCGGTVTRQLISVHNASTCASSRWLPATALRAACLDSETGRDTKPGHRNQMGSLKTKDPSEVAKAWLGLHQCSALRCVHTFCCNSTSGLQAQSASQKGQVTCLGSSPPQWLLVCSDFTGPFLPGRLFFQSFTRLPEPCG